MKKLFLLLTLCLPLLGCSLIPKINFGTASTVPQSINKSREKIICKGESKINENGLMTYCSKGYYNYAEDYSKKERKMTLSEKIKNYFNNLVGWSFWIVLLIIIICPSFLGFIVGRIMEAIFGIGTKALRQVATAVQKNKTSNPELVKALEVSTDENVKIFLADFKRKNNIK